MNPREERGLIIATTCRLNRLSRNVQVSMIAHLCGELANNPERYRHRLVPGFSRLFRYRFKVEDQPNRHIFTFLVEDYSGMGVLVLASSKRVIRPL